MGIRVSLPAYSQACKCTSNLLFFPAGLGSSCPAPTHLQLPGPLEPEAALSQGADHDGQARPLAALRLTAACAASWICSPWRKCGLSRLEFGPDPSSSRTSGLGRGRGVGGGGIAGFVFFLISALVRAGVFLFLQLYSLPSILPSVQTARQTDSTHLTSHSLALGKDTVN